MVECYAAYDEMDMVNLCQSKCRRCTMTSSTAQHPRVSIRSRRGGLPRAHSAGQYLHAGWRAYNPSDVCEVWLERARTKWLGSGALTDSPVWLLFEVSGTTDEEWTCRSFASRHASISSFSSTTSAVGSTTFRYPLITMTFAAAPVFTSAWVVGHSTQ